MICNRINIVEFYFSSTCEDFILPVFLLILGRVIVLCSEHGEMLCQSQDRFCSYEPLTGTQMVSPCGLL